MEAKIMAILCEVCGVEDGELPPGLDLIEAGLLDSFGVVQLLVKIEEQLGIMLDIELLRRENVATPAQLIELAKRGT